jgi:predicted TIM-barrel fold metal-dependent hydrolase
MPTLRLNDGMGEQLAAPETEKPNDAMLFDLLTEWAPDEPTRRRILVENPERLYGCPHSR